MTIDIDKLINETIAREEECRFDGWNDIVFDEVLALCKEILRLRTELTSQRAGMRDVLTAAVNLVCAPGWSGVSDEDVILEAALRQAGYVQPNEVAS